jgi:hypothetical protein
MAMLLADKIKIQCPHCGREFKEQAKKIRGGAHLPCPLCHEVIGFDDGSPDERIRKALSAARKLRRQATL